MSYFYTRLSFKEGMEQHTVIIVAGGQGTRMKSELPKQFLSIGGIPVIIRTLQNWMSLKQNFRFIVALPKNHIDYFENLVSQHLPGFSCLLSAGGETRFHTVQNALEKAPDTGLIAIHDAVRPFVSHRVILSCLETCRIMGNAIPVMEIPESIRQLDGKDSRPVSREQFRIVQTPQVFRSELVKKAYRQDFHTSFTDDASVVESTGIKIHLVEGNRENIKLTNPEDLALATLMLDRFNY